jgi:hypothetical protein
MDAFDELRALIDAVRRRWFALVALKAIGAGAGLAALPIAAAALAAWWLNLEGPVLLSTAVAASVAAALLAVSVVRRVPQRPSDVVTARFIEEQAAEMHIARLEDALVSAVQVVQGVSPRNERFAAVVVRQAATRLRSVPAAAIVPDTDLRRSGLQAAAGMICLVAAFVFALPALGRAADAAWLALFPHTITIAVQPGDTKVRAGSALRIRASLKGRGSTIHAMSPSLVVSSNGEERTVPMAADGHGYQFGFDSVDRSFKYKVVVGSVVSPAYSVTALFPARVRTIDLHYEYPSFSGLAPRTDEDSGDVYGPAGTQVRVRIHTDKPIAGGRLALRQGTSVPIVPAGDRVGEASLTLTKDDSYRINLGDIDGLPSKGETEYFIRIMDDRPPEVRILRPSADQTITPLEEVTIEARADDDYGIARFELVYAVAGRQERLTPFRSLSGTNVAKLGKYLLAAEDLQVQPGDVITYYARAVDVGRGKKPTETRSDIFFLEVKPFGEEFVAAQSQAMGAGGGAAAQLESLIAAQKEVINATWNLERRSGAGRSAEDLRAVAQAQMELKAKAEQIAVASRRFRNPYAPQRQIPQPPRRDPTSATEGVIAAVEAMDRAVEQLQGQKTREALPHEMAALRGLLQAQAEVRRRQVQQSANAGAQGGTSRMGQDLSALFDRELQRQQRTNYEQRSQIEQRADDPNETSAMDRIRDLARRQEDLSRRQRELLEAGLSADEMKRRLETLTREQEELRAQAEGMVQKGSEGVPKGSEAVKKGSEGVPKGAQSGDLQAAVEQMRRAASEMKRQDPRAAAERSREAAETLRRMEQDRRGNTPDGRQRAAGELQLEAQQIAEAQRRIAAEASRMQGTPGPATSDAQRRLSAEKEKLAERADALERSARQLGAQPSGGATDPASRARDAAAILERERVAQRMRESAKAMRPNAGGRLSDRQAQTEQEIAAALDRAAAAFTGRSAETQALSDELEQTRAMRERLNKLEQQLRDAQARESAGNRGGRGARAEPGQEGREGRQGRQGSTGSGQPGEVERLREQYARELQRTRDALGKLQGEQRSGYNMSTPETHEFSRSAPGTEAFKQDYSGWQSLRRDIDLALERYEASVSARLDRSAAADRLAAGGSDRVPDAYRQSVARYYQSLARLKQ